MKRLDREDIEGARITQVFSTYEVMGDYHCTEIYFRVDRGFVFKLPTPGPWTSVDVPEYAEEEPDEIRVESFGLGRIFFGRKRWKRQAPKKNRVIGQIKESPILGVYCLKEDAEPDFFEPDAFFLALQNGAQVLLTTFAPQGIPTGLSYWDQAKDLYDLDDCWNYFDPFFAELHSRPALF